MYLHIRKLGVNLWCMANETDFKPELESLAESVTTTAQYIGASVTLEQGDFLSVPHLEEIMPPTMNIEGGYFLCISTQTEDTERNSFILSWNLPIDEYNRVKTVTISIQEKNISIHILKDCPKGSRAGSHHYNSSGVTIGSDGELVCLESISGIKVPVLSEDQATKILKDSKQLLGFVLHSLP